MTDDFPPDPVSDDAPRDAVRPDAEEAFDATFGTTVDSFDDLEAAYRKALASVEAAEGEFDQAFAALAGNADDTREDSKKPDEMAAEGQVEEQAAVEVSSAKTGKRLSIIDDSAIDAPRIQPKRIIEAALFVGGMPLTTKKLSTLLRDEFDPDEIERLIEELNTQYADEARPYEIRFGEGGFRMCLRNEHERLRNRVFGCGPKDVRLSQEALEVLSLVAYKQPLSREDVEKLGRRNPAGILRQLVRRELVGIERSDEAPKEVRYRTTPRFLQLFGLDTLEDLPQADDLEFK